MKKKFNSGGFSWATFFGLTAQKRKLGKALGMPLTKSGRDAKLGRAIMNLFKGF